MKNTRKQSMSGGTWIIGTEEFDGEREIKIEILVFDEGSIYGISEGKISKLYITLGDETLAWYDRGWDTEPTEEVRPIYESIIAEFN